MSDTVRGYAHEVRLEMPYEQAVERVTAALKAEGFGVLTEIDVKATLKQKIVVDFRKYIILGACNPPLAYKALSTERNVGLLLPCNVIVYEEDGGSVVGILDPISMMEVTHNPDLDPVAQEAQQRLQRVAASLQG